MKFDRIIPKDRIKDYSAEISAVMKACKDMVHILIEPPRRSRTTGEKSQNHHLNGHIQQMGQSGRDIGSRRERIRVRPADRAVAHACGGAWNHLEGGHMRCDGCGRRIPEGNDCVELHGNIFCCDRCAAEWVMTDDIAMSLAATEYVERHAESLTAGSGDAWADTGMSYRDFI